MLYLIIPLSIAVLALIVAAVIVWRKMPYLRKLTPESHDVGDTLLHDFAPEAIDWAKGVPWRQYLHKFLAEFEAFLRKARGAMSAVDQLSGRLVRNVQRVGEQAAKSHEESVAQREEEKKQKEEEADPDEIDMTDMDEVKAEEQRLIVAIAQSPKDVALYSDIAKVYMRLHAYTDAVDALKQAVKLEPENEQFLKRLDRAQRKQAEGASEAAAQ